MDSPRPPVSLRWSICLLYAFGLVIGALVPSAGGLEKVNIPDWLIHALAYGALTALAYWAAAPLMSARRAMIVGVLGATIFGVLTEGLQLLQPARAVEVGDLAANAIGAILVCSLIAGFRGSLSRRSA